MHLTAQVLASIAYLFYPMMFIVVIMGMSGPNATNDAKALEALRYVLAYPIVISALFWLFDSTYLGIKGIYLVIISALLWLGATTLLSINSGISNLKKGIKNSGYSVAEGVAYYNAVPIENADVDSFYIYAEQDPSHRFRHDALAKDRNHLYRYGEVVPTIDPNTLEFVSEQNGSISGDFLKDHQHVYFHFEVLANADPETFVAISRAYFDEQGVLSRDKDTVWYNEQAISDIIPETADYVVGEENSSFYLRGQAKTSNEFYYYWQGKLAYTSQSSDAKALYSNMLVVDNHLFVDGKKYFTDTEMEHSTFVHDYFLTTPTRVFVIKDKLEEIVGADPRSFERLGYDYAKDTQRVYYTKNRQVVVLEDADAATFELVFSQRDYDAQDSRHRYYKGSIIRNSAIE